MNYAELANNPKIRAFLDGIAWAEGANYNTLYGGGTFADFSRHPNRKITAGPYTSTAAGRYQFLYGTWSNIQRALQLSDFSPKSQDIGAVYLIAQKGAINDILNDNPVGALKKFGCLWAALPYATCGQRRRELNDFLRRIGQTPSATPAAAEVVNYTPKPKPQTNDNGQIVFLALAAIAGFYILSRS